jgi:hypothetical protein
MLSNDSIRKQRSSQIEPLNERQLGVFQLSFTLFRPHDVFGDLSYSLIY